MPRQPKKGMGRVTPWTAGFMCAAAGCGKPSTGYVPMATSLAITDDHDKTEHVRFLFNMPVCNKHLEMCQVLFDKLPPTPEEGRMFDV